MRNDVSLRLNDIASKLANDVVSWRTQTQKERHDENRVFLFGAANQIRTGDLILTKDVLYHLSHSSILSFSVIIDSVNHYKVKFIFCQVFFKK